MSASQFSGSGAGKKAVHVKWAGKTIALGTFPAAEADEKCARAKALTRAWRSTMRPKPSRDWVMVELERLGVRVVSGRLGRKAGEDGDDGTPDPKKMGGMPGMDRKPSMGLGGGGGDMDFNNFMARRNSSLGLSMMNDMNRRGSLGSLGQVINMDGDGGMPPHRPMVGGGAAAAYEASRHDHYTQKSAEQQRRASSLGLGNLTGGGLGNMGMSVNPNQHYEMLKLHHMNLLNEIQETTLMMNLYQQQQLQQQQQHLQQQGAEMTGGGGGDLPGMGMMGQSMPNGGGGLDQMFQQQRNSLGLGTMNNQGGAVNNQQFMMQQQQNQMDAAGTVQGAAGTGDAGDPNMENRVAKLQEDIANRTKSDEAEDEDKRTKRDAEKAEDEPEAKRVKQEEDEEEEKGGDEEEDKEDEEK